MSKKKKNNEPPSLFDSLDLFAAAAPAPETKDEGHDKRDFPDSDAQERVPPAGRARPPRAPFPEMPEAESDSSETPSAPEPPPPPPSVPDARPVAPPPGLTGHGPLRELFDFNFRQYSAYVICSRAIPAVEDGLKPVQRRIRSEEHTSELQSRI